MFKFAQIKKQIIFAPALKDKNCLLKKQQIQRSEILLKLFLKSIAG